MRTDEAIDDERDDTTGERLLVIAVMQQAIQDARTVRRQRDAGYAEPIEVRSAAWRWIQSEANGPFSFRWCCDSLGLDHEVVRMEIDHRTPRQARATA